MITLEFNIADKKLTNSSIQPNIRLSLIPQVWNGTLRWRNLGILHVTNAKKYDSGTFRYLL